MQTETRSYVITRYDANRMRSVPASRKRFDDLNAALDEAARMNGFKRYERELLFVDLASAYDR